MNKSELKEIELHTKHFRDALENCPKNLLPITFRDFPRGSCGDACLLLAKYLQNMKCGFFDYVCGVTKRNTGSNFQSHAWLQREGLIIDITADQFEGINNPVIITRDTTWYDQFRIDDVNVADFDIYDASTVAELSVAYLNIIRFLSNEY